MDNSRFTITTIVENGYPHYKVHDNLTDNEIHCDLNELNETIWQLLGVQKGLSKYMNLIVAVDKNWGIGKNGKELTNIPLVLHGGSGVPDDQIKSAIEAGIRKINFGTDLCYSFLDKVFETSRDKIAIDVFMKDAIANVSEFAKSKIKLLGAENRA